MSEDIFKKILEKQPSLTSNGFENPSYSEDFENSRSTLIQSGFEEFKICCEWIEKHKTRVKKRDLKDYNFLKYHFNSYFLRHSVEKWSEREISNGAFIAALLFFDVSYKPIYGSPDVSVFLALNKETPYI